MPAASSSRIRPPLRPKAPRARKPQILGRQAPSASCILIHHRFGRHLTSLPVLSNIQFGPRHMQINPPPQSFPPAACKPSFKHHSSASGTFADPSWSKPLESQPSSRVKYMHLYCTPPCQLHLALPSNRWPRAVHITPSMPRCNLYLFFRP